MKSCPCCTRTLDLSMFGKRADGRPAPYCRQCAREKERGYREARSQPITHRADPLNLALRDMPGNRGPLLGIAGVRITEELRAA